MLARAAYVEICAALEGAAGYVTYGNADQVDMLRDHLPVGMRFVDAEVVEIEGWSVGFVGGGVHRIGVDGEITEEEMAAKLVKLGPVDVLCTHVPPLVEPLARDVIGGGIKGSPAVLDYVREVQPRHHFFGDIHQPQAVRWRVGETICRNVGYFRATGRGVRLA
jgi:Icc-related predicted phosphoesterase